MKGAAGLGDPLERPVEAVERDVAEGHIEAEFADAVYAVSDRDAARARRLERARPASEWWASERERVLAGELIEPVKVGYEESMQALAAVGGGVPRLLGSARGLQLRSGDADVAGRPGGEAGEGDAR